MSASRLLPSLGVALTLALTGCASTPKEAAEASSASDASNKLPTLGASPGPVSSSAPLGSERYLASAVLPGTGNFVNTKIAGKSTAPITSNEKAEVSLNFELADIRDIVKVVFDTLGYNYVIDPAVQGPVTIQTATPLPRSALLPTLESLLRMNGAALSQDSSGVYRVVPVSAALSNGLAKPRMRSARTEPGFAVRIVPLRFISAAEMEKILTPFAPQGGIVQVDKGRNLLMLAGTGRELDSLQETIDIFDVNWLQGMSVGVYRLENYEAKSAADELGKVFGPESGLPIAGMMRFVPITQLNTLLVLTPQVEYLREVEKWITRIDGSGGERLYVYNVENGDAAYLASVLGEIFGGGGGGGSSGISGGDVAPGMESTSLSSSGGLGSGSGGGSLGSSSSSSLGGSSSGLGGGSSSLSSSSSSGKAATAQSVSIGDQQRNTLALPGETVRIVADSENNSLLIWSNERVHDKILDALRKIDVAPRQVLVEVMVAEVTLTDKLRYGLQWFFKNEMGSYTGSGSVGSIGNQTTLNSVLNSTNLANAGSDLVYAISDSAGMVRALLDTLAADSKVNILSSPQLMVIDNQEATIRVGDQQPIQASTTVTDGGNTTSSIQYKDTGVLLKVKPKVNSSGLVSLNVQQQVIDVGETDSATGQRSFFERSIESKVAVQSGETIVLGGLIREIKRDSQNGVPILYKVPVIGSLFGQTNNENTRTELLIVITPRVAKDGREARQISDELKQRMQQVSPIIERAARKPLKAANKN